MIYYENDEFLIRDICEKDVVRLFFWDSDRELNKYDPKPTPGNTKELLEECKSYCGRIDNEVFNEDAEKVKYKYFIIADKGDNAIGFVNFFGVNKEKKQGEMGITLGDMRYWHKGIASKAVDVVTSYLFNNMDINRVYIETGNDNTPALNLFTRAGFKKCGEDIDEGFIFIVMEKLRH